MVDRLGIIYGGRPELTFEKKKLSGFTNHLKIKGQLADAVKGTDIFIGVSQAGILKPEMVKSMAQRAVIFALANPTPEIMPDLAKSAGAYIVATGRSDFPNQINNVLAFPGIFRGALDNQVKQITDKMLIRAGESLAGLVKHPDVDMILPDPFNAEISRAIAKAIF